MLRKSTCALLCALLAIFCASCAKKTPALNLLVWEGYADPSYVHAFEEANHPEVPLPTWGRATN